ncbi:hypothetical protein NW762_009919 [Fusarium torreyae]|uniref:Uncharacterized protein n=1 Tax=Fusarium torreyae TaxID=1237075 RepID=A0A9W8VB44_9HYPO|nr:hypothetical protein NW762_009919 [Fusarium torreyae]
MERSSKLADLKLVSKYYPVTNYSYPQQTEGQSYYARSRFSDDRASLGSEGSSPSLIDDRTDSEVSLDDDYQYHAHAAELWDSFWLPSKTTNLELQSRKQYPALIPSPQQQKKQAEEYRINAWPLSENSRGRSRKPVATYSPFPKPLPLPPRTAPLAPSWQCSRDVKQKPQRPPRPHEELYVFRSLQNTPLAAHFPLSPDSHKTTFSRPATATDHRPSTSLEMRVQTPTEVDSYFDIALRNSATRPCPPKSQPLSSHMLTKKSLPCMRPLPPTPQPEPEAEAEPHSVFEYDDDSDTESGGRSFWFHRRSGSDQRKIGHQTAPSSPRKRQGDVIGRMLGRRSRG